MDLELKKWGNSYGLRVSKKQAKRLGLQEGDKVEADLVRKTTAVGFGMCRGAQPFVRERDDRY